MILFLRSLLFSIGLWAVTLLLVPLCLIALPLGYFRRYHVLTLWTHAVLWWLELTCRLTFQVEGTEHIPQGNGIIFAKHQSAWETLALQQVFPPQLWVLKRELLRIPLFGWAMAMLHPIAIDRKAGRKAVEQVIEQGIDRLKQGWWLVIFPEGTRTAPGERRRYGIGGAALAERSGYPVVPVAHNAGEYWPRNGFIKRPGVIRVVVGPVIESRGKTAQQINAEAEAWIEQKYSEISTLPKAR